MRRHSSITVGTYVGELLPRCLLMDLTHHMLRNAATISMENAALHVIYVEPALNFFTVKYYIVAVKCLNSCPKHFFPIHNHGEHHRRPQVGVN